MGLEANVNGFGGQCQWVWAKLNEFGAQTQCQWVWRPMSMGLGTKLIEFSGVHEQRAIYTYKLPLLEALLSHIW